MHVTDSVVIPEAGGLDRVASPTQCRAGRPTESGLLPERRNGRIVIDELKRNDHGAAVSMLCTRWKNDSYAS